MRCLLTASCSLREFDFVRSGGSLGRQISYCEKKKFRIIVANDFIRFKSYPGLPEPEEGACAEGSGTRFSILRAGEGAAESLEPALARSEPLSFENLT